MQPTRKPYPTDISDEEWAFVAPYIALLREDAAQREHPLREVSNALRWMVRPGRVGAYPRASGSPGPGANGYSSCGSTAEYTRS